MKKLVAVIFSILCTVFGVRAEEATANTKPLADVKKEIQDGKAVLVDVREKDEWDEGHLKDAKFIPLSALKKAPGAAAELPLDKPVYLHCKAGKRSETAAKILAKEGYKAINIKEGYEELLEKGFEKAK